MSFQQFSSSSRELLHFVSEALFAELHGDETLSVGFRGEETDFVRWNQSKVRQNTSVNQKTLNFELHKNGRRLKRVFSVTGLLDWDLIQARTLLQEARKEAEVLPEDPYLVPMQNHGSSETEFPGQLLPVEQTIAAIAEPARSVDMAGLYAGGSIGVGHRNSKGQSHWFSNESFFMDFSLYNGERAVKGCYAGFHWQEKAFGQALDQAIRQLSVMNRPRKKLSPGKYKVYLAPAAVAEIAPMFSWQGVSYQAYKNGHSAFKKMMDGEKSISPLFNLSENFGLGLTPRFNELGELAPEKIPLIQGGHLKQMLVSSRSAKEFGVPGNFASSAEALRALEIGPGTLAKDRILPELGTGLYVSNLHYINWSDLQNARITGMTRYACLWVENGEIVAPIEDMRFDVSLYDIFGPGLRAVTSFQDVDPAVDTYEVRALGGKKIPGLLVEDFNFTL